MTKLEQIFPLICHYIYSHIMSNETDGAKVKNKSRDGNTLYKKRVVFLLQFAPG